MILDYNCSSGDGGGGNHEFQASLGYRVKLCLKHIDSKKHNLRSNGAARQESRSLASLCVALHHPQHKALTGKRKLRSPLPFWKLCRVTGGVCFLFAMLGTETDSQTDMHVSMHAMRTCNKACMWRSGDNSGGGSPDQIQIVRLSWQVCLPTEPVP